jgi:hypothetical protein
MQTKFSTLSFSIFTTLAILPTHIFANELENESISPNANQAKKKVHLTSIVLEAQDTSDGVIYSKEQLEKMPNSSKNITDFLKVNPNVQFGIGQNAANTQANLKPAEISINGAQSFQNKFVINGVNNTNILDPMGVGDASTGQLNSGSQGVILNTDLLCRLEVLDSNVSAKHSGFTGGVVAADTCAPDTEIGKVHGSIIYDYTSSAWSRYNIETEADRKRFDGESTQSNQKEYTKQGLSATAYTKLSETTGIDVFASMRESIIPVASGFDSPKTVDQKKQNINIGSTVWYNPNDTLKSKFGFTYGNLNSNNYVESRRDSKNKIDNHTALVFGEISKKLDHVTVTQKLNYQQIDNARDWDTSISKIWLYSEGSKDWVNKDKVFEGSMGTDVTLKQRSIAYDLDAVFDPIQLGSTTQQWGIGAGYRNDHVSWNRPGNYEIYSATTSGRNQTLFDLKGEQCLVGDLLCDESLTASGFNGQYFAKGNINKAGSFKGTYEQSYIYAENNISWRNFTTRLGLRADYDSSNHNFNLAPRTNISYKPFSNESLKLLAGWNRYYSAPTYITDLQRQIADLNYTVTRTDQNTPWVEEYRTTATSTRKSDLKTPYTDEFVASINSQVKNININLKWVNRKFKDEITRNHTNIPNNNFIYSYEYGNSGFGKSDIYSLSLNTISPIEFYNTQHQFGIGLDYTETYRGSPDYASNFKEADMNEMVVYNGEIIRYIDRPSVDFNQPFTARLSWDIQFKNLPININNYLSYKNAYKYALIQSRKYEHNGDKLDVYNIEKIKDRFSWDIRATYALQLANDYSTTFGLTINNVTNHKNLYPSSGKLYSDVGRQFVADITFKF